MSSAGDLSDRSSSSVTNFPSDDEVPVRMDSCRLNKWRVKKNADMDSSIDQKFEIKSMQQQMELLEGELQTERESAMLFRRKLTACNKEKLEQTAQFNEEMNRLHSQNAGLQAELEKQADITGQLEFQLTRANKQISDEKRLGKQKESSAATSINQLEELVSDYKLKAASLSSEVKRLERERDAELESLRLTISDRDKLIQESCYKQQSSSTERVSMQELIAQQEQTIVEHKKQYESLRAEFNTNHEHLANSNENLVQLRASEEQYVNQLHELAGKVAELSEAVEAERAAHLQSQFNSEVIQLKVADLESCLEEERKANIHLSEELERLSSQHRELEQAYSDQCTQNKNVSAKLDRCEKEYTLSQRQLQTELSDKRNLVSNLKQQLDMHQSNVDDLKAELNRAKKRQHSFEESYGGGMRELELLLLNFDLDKSDTADRQEVDAAAPPNVVLTSVKHTLSLYKRRLEQTSAELIKVSDLYEKLSGEAKSTKDQLWAKDKALEDTQRKLISCSKELDRLAYESTDTLNKMAASHAELKDLKSANEGLCNKQDLAHKELAELRMVHLRENEEKMRFLHGLYQRLSLTSGAGRSAAVQAPERFAWAQLADLVLEQVVSVLTERQHLKHKIGELDSDTVKAAEVVERIKKDYEMQLEGLSQTIERNRGVWSGERRDLERQYEEMLSQAEEQKNKDRQSSDEAWTQVKQTSQSLSSVEGEIQDLKSRIMALQKHNSAVLCAFALICGAYFPLVNKHRQLARQRNLLDDQYNKCEAFKRQVRVLLQTLGSEGLDSSPPRRSSCGSARLTFRRAVIVTLAANRLRRLARFRSRLLSFPDSNRLAFVCVGSLKHSREIQEVSCITDSDIVDWLSNKDIITTVLSCTKDLITTLRHHQKKESSTRPDQLADVTRVCFRRLLDAFSSVYPLRYDEMAPSPRHPVERHGLVNLLARGLAKALQSTNVENLSIVPSQKLLTCLQERVISFIKSLHQSEIERRSLKERLSALQEAANDLQRVEHQAQGLELELQVLKGQNENMVPVERFEGTVKELNITLTRERQAQELLSEQSNRLRMLTEQLEQEETNRRNAQKQLSTQAQEMEKDRGSLNARMETIQALKARLSRLELERTQLQDGVFDAEIALKTAARDRESISTYITAIAAAFEKLRPDALSHDISKSLTAQAARLLDDGSVPETLALHSLFSLFTDCLRASRNHIQGLTDEIESHKRHVTRLKDELSAACKRQSSGPTELTNQPHLLEEKLTNQQRLQFEAADQRIQQADSDTDFVSVQMEPDNSSDGSVGALKFAQRPPPPTILERRQGRIPAESRSDGKSVTGGSRHTNYGQPSKNSRSVESAVQKKAWRT